MRKFRVGDKVLFQARLLPDGTIEYPRWDWDCSWYGAAENALATWAWVYGSVIPDDWRRDSFLVSYALTADGTRTAVWRWPQPDNANWPKESLPGYIALVEDEDDDGDVGFEWE